jgi:hypothetical protein
MCRIYCISAAPIPVINPHGRTIDVPPNQPNPVTAAPAGTGRRRRGQKLMALSDAIGSGRDFTIALLDRLRADGIDPAQLFKTREA